MTLLAAIISITYLSMRLFAFANQTEEQTFKSYPLNRNLYDPDQSMDVNNSEFNVAFGSQFTDIPPNIGRIAAYYVNSSWTDGIHAVSFTEIKKTSCIEDILNATGSNERTAQRY